MANVEKTRNDIIEQALRLLGVVALGENPSADQSADATKRLDWMIRSWQTSGAHLWKEGEATLFPQKDTAEYQLGGTAHATESYTSTTLSAAAVSGATTVSLTLSTGLAINDYIGIKQDDGTRHWAQVTATSPVTLDTALTANAASGNNVVFYTTKIGKPLRVPHVRRNVSGIDTEVMQCGREDYFNLPNKTSTGQSVQYYYNPKLNNGTLYLWPIMSDVDYLIKFTYYQEINLFTTTATDADFPDEWVEALAYNLAIRLAPDYGFGVPPEVAAVAAQSYQNVLNWDQGDASVFFEYGRG